MAVSEVNSLTSLMTSVLWPRGRTTANSKMMELMMAMRDEGTTLNIFNGILGKNSMMSMLEKQMVNIQYNSGPLLNSSVSGSMNGCSWARPMTIARPLQNPIMTGAGNSVMKRDKLRAETKSIKKPANITEGKRSSTPGPFSPVPASGMKVPMMAAKAPVAPLTMPGRPPKTLQIRPTIQAACSAIGGLTLAMKAKATDSGICAKQMVMPNSTSRMT
mmetsp:Transcript_41687/g.134795  ORF Transcript_41687/g.134795 Transcript_41687/m.134795 type:complete len:217 (+) Transcript_41687:924-1574(+)